MNKKILTLIFSTLIIFNALAESNKQEIGLLNKIGYGVTQKSLAIVKKEGIDNWIMQQLKKPNFYDDSEIENKYKFAQTKEEIFLEYKANDFTLNDNKRNTEYFDGKNGVVTKSLLKRVDYALNSENRLREMMVWFWFNHFNIGVYTNDISGIFVNDYEQKIRKNSLGNFKDILKMVSHHPTMLNYLNNSSNRDVTNDPEYGINENYAREFLELHTLGVNGGYNQKDVRELARILTGFNFMHLSDYDLGDVKKTKDYNGMGKLISKEYRWSLYNYVLDDFFLFDGKYHDYKSKKFLNKEIKGQGLEELDEVIDMLIQHPNTALFLSKKMAIYLMNDNPSKEIVDEMANRFLKTKGDIAETLKPLLISEEYKKSLEKPEKVKDSYTFFLSTIKTAINNEPGKNKENKINIINLLKYVQADPYFTSTPEGFSVYGKDWISSSRLQENIFFVLKTIELYSSNKNYSINYKLLELIAEKPIKNNQDAAKFLTSENWLKR